MDAIFTLPYSEYEVINELKKKLKNGYSFYIPTSRQQKGIDFLIHNSKNNNLLRIQVKSSRAYIDEPGEKKNRRRKYKYNLWFNNFIEKVSHNDKMVDFYLLFGLYPEYKTGKNKNIRAKSVFWKKMVVCFSEKEMANFLKNIKVTKNKKQHRFFGFGFDESDKIFATTGFEDDLEMTEFLLDMKTDDIKSRLGENSKK